MSSKACLNIFNGTFSVGSIVLVIFGASMHSFLRKHPSLLNHYVSIPAPITMALGSVMYCISMFGHLSVCCQSRTMLLAYSYLMFVLIFVELCAGITAFASKGPVLRLINDLLRSAEQRYLRDDDDKMASKTWNVIQKYLRCCGVNNYTEWFQYFGNSSLPDSCCANYTTRCGSGAFSTNNLYQIDCARAIKEWVLQHEIYIALFLAVLVCLTITVVLLARDHLKSLRKECPC